MEKAKELQKRKSVSSDDKKSEKLKQKKQHNTTKKEEKSTSTKVKPKKTKIAQTTKETKKEQHSSITKETKKEEKSTSTKVNPKKTKIAQTTKETKKEQHSSITKETKQNPLKKAIKKCIKNLYKVIILLIFISISYAVFNYDFLGEINKIEKNSIELEFLESSGEIINIENALPIDDETGKKQEEYFAFQVKTKTFSTVSIGYNINLKKLEASDGYTMLNDNEVKIYLTDYQNREIIPPTLISDLPRYSIYKKYHNHNKINEEIKSKYKLRVWLDSETDVSTWDENTKVEYKFKIDVNTLGQETYKVVFNSNNGDKNTKVQPAGYDENFWLERNEFEYEGYQFMGWATSEEGKILYEDKQKVGDLSGDSNEVNLYAQWKREKNYKGYNVYDAIIEDAVSDNVSSKYVKNSDGIDFSEASSEENGKGVYILSDSANEENPIYYYRGNVDNNNITVGKYCWKVLRTTETKGVKLVFNGLKSEDGTCNNAGAATQVTKQKAYNGTGIGIAGAGYSYTDKTSLKLNAKNDSTVALGTIFANDVTYNPETGMYTLNNDRYLSTANFTVEKINNLKTHHYTCFKTVDEGCSTVYYVYMERDAQIFYATLKNGQKINDLLNIEFEGNSTNQIKSTIHTAVETWYANEMTSLTSYIEDTIYCNDRSLYNPWNASSVVINDNDLKMHFATKARVAYQHEPNIACKYKADSFTVDSTIGNGALTYPTGLITYDEAALAGVAWNKDSRDSFLHNDQIWWTMSPGFVSATGVYMGVIHSMTDHVAVNYTGTAISGGVRPLISIKYGVKIDKGSGTANDPFTVA